MKHSIIGLLLITSTLSIAQDTLAIATKSCEIKWHAEKVTGAHTGNVSLEEGYILIEDGKLFGGAFLVDMTSMTCTDLKRPYRDKLIQHLRSEDFFDVERFPLSQFTITAVKVMEDGAFDTEVIGNITIKGVTEQIRFPAKVKIKDNKFAAYGEMALDRTKFGIRWGSSSFIDDLGDRAIDDIFRLNISLGARR